MVVEWTAALRRVRSHSSRLGHSTRELQEEASAEVEEASSPSACCEQQRHNRQRLVGVGEAD